MDSNAHKSFKDCDTATVGKFISLLHGSGNYKRVSYYPVDEKSHFERFGYLCGDSKISVVYDTKAKILSLTANAEQIEVLSAAYINGVLPQPKQSVQTAQKLPAKQSEKQKLPAKQDKNKQKLPAKQDKNKQKLPVKQGEKQKLPANRDQGQKLPISQTGNQTQKTPVKTPSEQKKQEKQSRQNNKNEANSGGLAKNNKQRQAAEKKLKKLLPSAYDYLSALAKNDLTSALTDIYNDEIRLSDYSGLLVSPYRGLERFIYDLQTSEGIRVKMIGQAYEKRDDGSYCLKSGYRKRIKSIVYNEVMSALYTEYFEKRNFYLHSNNSLSTQSRVISDREEARKIFDNLLSIIEYNGAKLREIRFSVKEAQGE